MSEYKNIVGGKLNLKGTDINSRKRKKNKKKAKKEKEFEAFLAAKLTKLEDDDNNLDKKDGVKVQVEMTETEKQFEQVQRLLEEETNIITKRLKKSHKERIDDFNLKLSLETQHFDIPKVGPG